MASLPPFHPDPNGNGKLTAGIYAAAQEKNPAVLDHRLELLSIFEKVLGPPEEQLDDETRALIRATGQALQ